jgi:2-polyprenyl-3-methyl-5-hydroxy-6-metoxy-1,4-benzoquinol methylase
MRFLDRFLRDRRIDRASAFIGPEDTVLDIGCSDGYMFERLKGRFKFGVGVDPAMDTPEETPSFALYRGSVPGSVPPNSSFDVITMLAVLEHLAPPAQIELANACYELLRPGGRIVITVPAPLVDKILHVLQALRLVDGMSLHEHYGFEPDDTLRVFGEARLNLQLRRRFQLGLNNLFVFEKV